MSGSPTIKKVAEDLIAGMRGAIEALSIEEVDEAIKELMRVRRGNGKVIVIGMGRSGLVGRAFAMRLMHIGFNVHVVGETITPALSKGDLLFAISGSGSTTFVVDAAKIAKKTGAKVLSVTSYPKSALGKLSDLVIRIPGRIKGAGRRDYFSRQILGEHEPLAPLGTLFEISSMIFLDSLIIELMRRLKITEEELKKRHATIE